MQPQDVIQQHNCGKANDLTQVGFNTFNMSQTWSCLNTTTQDGSSVTAISTR